MATEVAGGRGATKTARVPETSVACPVCHSFCCHVGHDDDRRGCRVFAPGHLGELTRIVPFELADAVLEEEGGLEKRVRLVPSRAGLYFLLAMCLFPQPGYLGVGGKLTAGL